LAGFLAEERVNLGQWSYDQEYGYQFLDSDSAAFRTEDFEAASEGEFVELWNL